MFENEYKIAKTDSFLTRFYAYAYQQDKCLLAWPNSPLDLKLCPERIYWEQQRNDDLRLIRSLIIDYASDDVRKVLKGNGEAYVGGSHDFMAPYEYEKLNINIPSDNVDMKHVWKLYEEWLINWTASKDLRALIDKPIIE